ncbi:MAG: superoxide dismutase [Micavibrio aeruginosavorus]|uniref:Superoxide dismutase n=1 Tax=Micavibrio aeruginosavorus TaxID=349221 RepID=A0A2W4ZXD2_9BACT|nr:MAG: superoxide dismutase [Micavibrio aeruginosavorus]
MKNLMLLALCLAVPVGLAVAANKVKASAANSSSTQGAFALPALPYTVDALEGAIDEETMQIHHGKHHQAYVDNLNKEIEKTAALKGKTLEQIMMTVSKYPAAVRNNAGGHWNHSFFWTIMTPETTQPSPQLAAAIDSSFGSMEEFKKKFEEAGTKQFGSGWAWLIVGKDGKLQVTSTPNQDNPLMDDAKVKGTPVLGNDVWEHAYYLRYQNKRADYLKAWWNVVNWNRVSELYAQASTK